MHVDRKKLHALALAEVEAIQPALLARVGASGSQCG